MNMFLNNRRKGSDDDLNERDRTGYDMFAKSAAKGDGSFIQPIAVDHYKELGKGLG